MRIRLDENLPGSLVKELSRLGHDVDTAIAEGLAGHSDSDIWQAAQDSGRFLITQDLDFSDLRLFAPGTHFGILLVRLQRPSRAALRARVQQLFESEAVEAWSRCFVVATRSKIRVRVPRTR